MPKRILVIGATGLFGVPTAHQLKEDGFIVRVMTRDKSKAKKYFNDDFEIMEGSVTDMMFLEDAMKDCHGVHISVSGDDDRPGAENVASLAQQMGVKHVTYVSGSTVCDKNTWFPMIKQKVLAEKAIINSGVGYTIFKPTWPMEQLPRFVRDGKVNMIGKQPAKLHWFAVNDFARMISTAYSKKEALNKSFYIHGPEGYTLKEALEIYCNTFHPEIKKFSVLPIWVAKPMKLLVRNDMFKMVVDLMSYFEKTGELGDPAEAYKILGEPTTTLGMWMKPKVEKKIPRVGK